MGGGRLTLLGLSSYDARRTSCWEDYAVRLRLSALVFVPLLLLRAGSAGAQTATESSFGEAFARHLRLTVDGTAVTGPAMPA